MRLIILLLLVSFTIQAQDFRKVKVTVGFGYTSPKSNYNSSNGEIQNLIFLEPAYRINKRLLVAIRLEHVGSVLLSNGLSISSYGINGQYYFSDKIFRPFAGIGISQYHPILTGGFYGYNSRLEETVLGFYPRLGFDYGHLSLMVEMNITNSSSAIISSPSTQTPATQGLLSSNYFSIKIGVSIGGGRK